MFLGQYERSLDDKSRIAIPAELRSGLGSGAILTRSFDNCLCIYPAAKWDSIARAIDDFQDVRPEARDVARALFSGAVPCEFDRQGRIVIPAFLREHASLNGEAVVVGVGSRVEIWSQAAWARQRDSFEGGGADLARALSASSV
jgi:MraZ protein